MAEGLLGMMSESSGREGTLRLMYYGARRGLVECCCQARLKAAAINTVRCLVHMNGAAQAMIKSCVSAAPDRMSCKHGACQCVRSRVLASSP